MTTRQKIITGLRTVLVLTGITVIIIIAEAISRVPKATPPTVVKPKPLLPVIKMVPVLSKKPVINFEVLADVIKIHENSVKYPYGCHIKRDGKFIGFPEPVARAKCIKICKSVYEKWDGKGNYFRLLNKKYAEDTAWYKNVQRRYGQKLKS